MSPNIGMCFDRNFPAGEVTTWARELDTRGVDQLWVIEDCFYTAGVSLAGAALAVSERLTVGLGILPAVARNPAITAMEIATLAGIAPGRVVAGIGHGVQDWMGQMGARTPSPVTTLEEVLVAVRALLRGEEVTSSGREVTLDHVQLVHPPSPVPPVVAGVRGPRSMAVAGRSADGVVLAEGSGPAAVRAAREQAGDPADWRISTFTSMCIMDDRQEAYSILAPVVADWLASASNPGVDAHPHGAEIRERWREGGVDAIASMPREWWLQLTGAGTFDDVVEHVHLLAEAGVHDVAMFPAPELDVAREQLEDVVRLAAVVHAAG